MTEPTRGDGRVPALALGFALVFAISWAAMALLLAGGFVLIEGAPDLNAGLGLAILFPVIEVVVLVALAAIVGAISARWRARREGLLGGLLGILAGGVLVSLAIARLAGEGETGGIGIGLFLTVLGIGSYLGGFMIGHSIASADPSVPSRWPSPGGGGAVPQSDAEDAGPRWPAP